MSVINSMLTDLEARRAAPISVGAAVISAAPPAPGRIVRRLKLVGLAGAVLVVSAAAFGNWPAMLRPIEKLPRPVGIGPEVALAPQVGASPAAAVTAAVSTSPADLSASPTDVAAAPAAVVASAALATSPALATVSAPLAPANPAIEMPSLATAVNPAAAIAASTSALPGAAPAAPADARVWTEAAEVRVARASPAAAERYARTEPSIEKKMAEQSPAQRAELAYRQAGEMTASGHTNPAIDRALEAIQADPSHVAARRLAAVLLCEKGRFEEAAVLLRAGLERSPGEPYLAYLLARLKVEAGDPDAALALLAPTATLSAEGHALRAAILSQQGLYAQALPSYEAALRKNPDNTSGWLGLAVALDAQGDTPQARQAFQRARDVGARRGDLSGELQTYIEQRLATLR